MTDGRIKTNDSDAAQKHLSTFSSNQRPTRPVRLSCGVLASLPSSALSLKKNPAALRQAPASDC